VSACIFCDIVADEVPASFVHRDERALTRRRTSASIGRPAAGSSSERRAGRRCAASSARELDVELSNVAYLGALESVFTFEGQPGHEVVLVYRADLAADERFALESGAGAESDGTPYTARWLPLNDVRTGVARLYPDGLLDLLDETT